MLNIDYKENLDNRICDVEGVANTQTYREFIRESEEEFCIANADLENMSEEDLKSYICFLDELWCK